MPRPGFVHNVEIYQVADRLKVRWQPPIYGDTPDRYIVLLRDAGGSRVPDSRKVVNASDALEVEYDGMAEGQIVKVGIRSRLRRYRGKWLYHVVTIGDDVPPMADNRFMDYIEAGEPTPDDAIGDPTRHVKLYDDGWRRFDPVQAYIAADIWWHFNEVALAEDRLETAEADVDDWEEDNPGERHPILHILLEAAQKEVVAIRKKLKERETEARIEAEKKYPPENLTEKDGRWVERPKIRK